MLKYLNNKLVLVEKDSVDKDFLISKMISVIKENTDVIENEADFHRKIMEREKIGTTGIGKGVAVPHARCDNLKRMVFSIAILKRGIDFNSPDDEKVKIVVMVGAPKTENTEYLNLLSFISKLFRNKDVRDSLILSSTPEEVLETIAGFCN